MAKVCGKIASGIDVAVMMCIPLASIDGTPARAGAAGYLAAASLSGDAATAEQSGAFTRYLPIDYDDYDDGYYDDDYDGYSPRTFSPGGGIICYRARRICYDPDGTVSKGVTKRIFGRRDSRGSTFSPGGGVICYRAERICYDPDGTVSKGLTKRIFGRRDNSGRVFSPGGGIICYRAERICYDPDGTVSKGMTKRLFGG